MEDEIKYLKEQRDFYLGECRDLKNRLDATDAGEKARELRDFVDKATEMIRGRFTKWLAGLTVFLGIGTLGGTWKMDQMITDSVEKRVGETVQAKTKDIEDLRKASLENIIRHQVELEDARKKFTIETDRFKAFSESKQQEVAAAAHRAVLTYTNADGTKVKVETTAPEGSSVTAWFPYLPPGVVAISGSLPSQYAMEADGEGEGGAFTAAMLAALRSPRTDLNSDKIVDFQELVNAAQTTMGASKSFNNQSPFVIGPAASTAIINRSSDYSRKGILHLIIVGVGKSLEPELGAIKSSNDVKNLTAFFASNRFVAFSDVNTTSLADEAATRAKILAALDKAVTQAVEGDGVIFYFSGRSDIVSDRSTGTNEKRLMPFDWTGKDPKFVTPSEIAEALGKSKASTKVIIIDA